METRIWLSGNNTKSTMFACMQASAAIHVDHISGDSRLGGAQAPSRESTLTPLGIQAILGGKNKLDDVQIEFNRSRNVLES